jgi:hypothetical protein
VLLSCSLQHLCITVRGFLLGMPAGGHRPNIAFLNWASPSSMSLSLLMVTHAFCGPSGTGCVSLGIPAWSMSDEPPVTAEAEPADDFVPLSQGNYVWRPGIAINDQHAVPSKRHFDVADLAARALRRGGSDNARRRSRSPPLHPNFEEIQNASALRAMGAVVSASRSAVSSAAPAYPGMGYVPQRTPEWVPVPRHGGTPLPHVAQGCARHADQCSLQILTPAVAHGRNSPGRASGQAAPPVVNAAVYARETAASFLDSVSRAAEAAPAVEPAVVHHVPSEAGSPTGEEEDAELLQLCQRLEQRFAPARSWAHMETQTTTAVSWPACVLPSWAWQAHAARMSGRSAADRVLVELSSPALTWARILPHWLLRDLLNIFPYLACTWHDPSAALMAMSPAALFLSGVPVTDDPSVAVPDHVGRIVW